MAKKKPSSAKTTTVSKTDKEPVVKETKATKSAKKTTTKDATDAKETSVVKMGAKKKTKKVDKEIQYPSIEAFVYQEGSDPGPLRAVEATEILGWIEEDEDLKLKDRYDFKDLDKKKVRLSKNQSNRPFRRTLALRYANEILRRKWALNGEPIILDEFGEVQSGQHRLTGLVFAHQMWKNDPEKWRAYWKESPCLETILVVGISHKDEVIDTLDIGQKRSLGDVLYRNQEFEGFKKRQMSQMSNMLSQAVRLVWLRVGGKDVTDALQFPHSEALEFLQEHRGLVDSVKSIMQKDGGPKGKSRYISKYMSLSYAAGLYYLMATSGTNGEAWDEGSEEIDYSMQPKADEFWHFFCDPKPPKAIESLKMVLDGISAGGASGRDEIIGTCIRAFKVWVSGKSIDPDSLRLKRSVAEDGEKSKLLERPTLGGLDVGGE